MILVDTNVLLDLVTDDPTWAQWSLMQLENAAIAGPLLINDVIYAELSVRYDTIEKLNSFITDAGLLHVTMPQPALFLAARVFATYRRPGGSRTGVLPDFFIGAHAAVEGLPLLTRDVGRYQTYFPTLQLIAP